MRSVKAAFIPAFRAGEVVQITGDKNYRGQLLYVTVAEAGDYYAGVIGFVPRPEDKPIRFQRKELGKVVGRYK